MLLKIITNENGGSLFILLYSVQLIINSTGEEFFMLHHGCEIWRPGVMLVGFVARGVVGSGPHANIYLGTRLCLFRRVTLCQRVTQKGACSLSHGEDV